MTIEAPGGSAARSRWLMTALVASLAANLLFAGWLGAAVWHHRKGGGWRGGDGGLMGFVRQLPDERRPAMRARVKAARENVKPLKAELNDAWTAANATLAAEPFDKAAAKAAFVKTIEADAKLRAAIDDELIATAEQLSADERKVLHAWREKRKPHVLRRHGRKDRSEGTDDSVEKKPE